MVNISDVLRGGSEKSTLKRVDRYDGYVHC